MHVCTGPTKKSTQSLQFHLEAQGHNSIRNTQNVYKDYEGMGEMSLLFGSQGKKIRKLWNYKSINFKDLFVGG